MEDGGWRNAKSPVRSSRNFAACRAKTLHPSNFPKLLRKSCGGWFSSSSRRKVDAVRRSDSETSAQGSRCRADFNPVASLTDLQPPVNV